MADYLSFFIGQSNNVASRCVSDLTYIYFVDKNYFNFMRTVSKMRTKLTYLLLYVISLTSLWLIFQWS